MFSVTILDFDHLYRFQSFYKGVDHCWVDLSDLSGVRYFCHQDTLRDIDLRIPARTPQLLFIGSGNYHYVTYLLLRRIHQPFTLALFDYHPDLLPSPSDEVISCGSWVLRALQTLPDLKKVVILGIHDAYKPQLPESLKPRVSIYTARELSENTWLSSQLLQDISTPILYISIDKDVLSKEIAVTNWNQGDLSLDQLLETLNLLLSRYHIVGVDVCGEPYWNGDTLLNPTVRNLFIKNSKTNERILRGVLRQQFKQKAG